MTSKLGYNYNFGKEIGNGGFGRVVIVTRIGDASEIEYAAKIFENDSNQDESLTYDSDSNIESDSDSDCKTIKDKSVDVGVLREISTLTMFSPNWVMGDDKGTPNIIKIIDVGYQPETGNLFMVMPLMMCDLHVAIKKNMIKDVKTKVKIAHGILTGIYYLHVNDIIHRDIKTENILLDKDFTPYIADFSLSKVFGNYENEKDHTHTGDVGTEVFRAPEVIRGGFYNKSIDIYSCGVIFMELFNTMINTRKDSVARKYIIESINKMPSNSISALLRGMLCENPISRYTCEKSLSSSIFQTYRGGNDFKTLSKNNNKTLNKPKIIKKYMSKRQKKSQPKVIKDEVHRIWVQLTFSNPVTKEAARVYYEKCLGDIESRYCVLVASKIYESQLLSINFIDDAINNFDMDDYRLAEITIMDKMNYDLFI